MEKKVENKQAKRRQDLYMGDCQNYGPFWGPYYNTGPNTGPNLGDPKRHHNFDNPPYGLHTDMQKPRYLSTSCEL